MLFRTNFCKSLLGSWFLIASWEVSTIRNLKKTIPSNIQRKHYNKKAVHVYYNLTIKKNNFVKQHVRHAHTAYGFDIDLILLYYTKSLIFSFFVNTDYEWNYSCGSEIKSEVASRGVKRFKYLSQFHKLSYWFRVFVISRNILIFAIANVKLNRELQKTSLDSFLKSTSFVGPWFLLN